MATKYFCRLLLMLLLIMPGPAGAFGFSQPDPPFLSRLIPPESSAAREVNNRAGGEEKFHFLLIGRHPEEVVPAILMVVTLVPESCSSLLSLDPATLFAPAGRASLFTEAPSGRLLSAETGRLTGRNISFYLELNLDGFVTMVDLIGGSPEHPEAARNRGEILPGKILLQRLTENRPGIKTGEKQELITALLETARDLEGSSLGLKLLLTGYRSLQTDMTLSDLLQLRAVTQKIRPDRVYLEEPEITVPGRIFGEDRELGCA